MRARLVGLAAAHGWADTAPLRVRERAHRRARRQAEHPADGRVPRARLRRGNLVAGMRARQARGAAWRRPARAAEAQLRRGRRDGRTPVLLEGPDGVLPAGRAALGAAPGGPRPLGRDLEARDGDGEPDLVRRRRAAQLCVGAPRLGRSRERGHGDAGHRHGHAHGGGDDRGRGARPPARPHRGAGRGLGTRPLRLDLGRLVDAPLDGTRRALGGRGCRSPGGGAGGAAVRSPGGDAFPPWRQHRLLRRRQLAARRDHRPAGRRPDPGQGRARPEPDRDARAHVRAPARRGRRRRRHRRSAGREGRRRSTTSAA